MIYGTISVPRTKKNSKQLIVPQAYILGKGESLKQFWKAIRLPFGNSCVAECPAPDHMIRCKPRNGRRTAWLVTPSLYQRYSVHEKAFVFQVKFIYFGTISLLAKLTRSRSISHICHLLLTDSGPLSHPTYRLRPMRNLHASTLHDAHARTPHSTCQNCEHRLGK